jgi:malonate-semialdehyde dehydrogenase (acetylating) / methylmalonate-semialdehyde dehydrogenase
MSEIFTKKEVKVISPIDGKKIGFIDLHSVSELNEAVEKSQTAFEKWSKLTLRERSQILYRYRDLLVKNIDSLSELVQKENGKTLPEARAEIEKAIEITEFACSLPQICTDKILEVSKGIHCRISKKPLGVVASITPFNFPSMVPHWTIPIALALGNSMILKPSEIVPLSAIEIAKYLKLAGLPDNVFQVIFGEKEIVEAICDHQKIKAVSFVGSTKVAKIVYSRATSNYKRALCLGGAKNHILVLPDANEAMTANNIVASMAGCAGQRCMAASVMVAVGDSDHIVKSVVSEAKKVIPGKNLGAVISEAAKERIENYITQAEKQGAKILLDGRNTVVKGKEGGYYVGPTIIDDVLSTMAIAKEEVFGPVLSIIRSENIDEAIEIQNRSNYGNGASVFTQNARLSTDIAERLKAGMIGVNIGVPVPREPFSFGGWDDSRFGVGDITGESSIGFWTQDKKTTVKWNPEDRKDWMS